MEISDQASGTEERAEEESILVFSISSSMAMVMCPLHKSSPKKPIH